MDITDKNIEFLATLQYISQASTEAQQFIEEFVSHPATDPHIRTELLKAKMTLELQNFIVVKLNEEIMEAVDELSKLKKRVDDILKK